MAARAKAIPARFPDYSEEAALRTRGYAVIAGVDEVGRGPLAGPVVAGAAILPGPLTGEGATTVRDSKQLTAPQREQALSYLEQNGAIMQIGIVSPQEIDDLGIAPATRLAMSRAIAKLEPSPAYLLLDAVVLSSVRIPQKSIIKGDSLSQSIAAASIAAKVARDRMMDDMDAEYPGYGFARHKGYGTREHIEALKRLGPCVIHRASFAPVRTLNPPLFALDKRATGTQGEDIAAQLLKASGYEIIGRNVRIGRSEIDIVASIGGTLVFVEVRARHGDAMGMPEESLSRSKQTHMVTAAQRYLAEHGDRVTDWRIDLVAIDLGPNGKPTRTEIIEYAVELDS